MSYFEERFYDPLIIISLDHDTAHLFAACIDILEDYHLVRSFRRGATTRVTNAGVKQDDIDWLCSWNTGGEETGGAPLRVLYSDRYLCQSHSILRNSSTFFIRGDISAVITKVFLHLAASKSVLQIYVCT
jgi:hypothetical protein